MIVNNQSPSTGALCGAQEVVMSTSSQPRPLRLGFLYPGYAAEDDYPRLAALLIRPVEVVADVVHTSVGEDAHRVDALLDLGDRARLLEGAQVLRERGVAAAMWACTSGSFVFGWEGARAQVAALEDFLGVPASSTSFAFVDAAHAIGTRRVAVAATYPEDVAQRFVDFLRAGGIEVLQLGSRGIITAAEVGTLGQAQVEQMVRDNDHPDADAVVLPDTALHTVAWLEALEAVVHKPVLSANQVSFWQALRLAGVEVQQNRLGTLFQAGVAVRR